MTDEVSLNDALALNVASTLALIVGSTLADRLGDVEALPCLEGTTDAETLSVVVEEGVTELEMLRVVVGEMVFDELTVFVARLDTDGVLDAEAE